MTTHSSPSLLCPSLRWLWFFGSWLWERRFRTRLSSAIAVFSSPTVSRASSRRRRPLRPTAASWAPRSRPPSAVLWPLWRRRTLSFSSSSAFSSPPPLPQRPADGRASHTWSWGRFPPSWERLPAGCSASAQTACQSSRRAAAAPIGRFLTWMACRASSSFSNSTKANPLESPDDLYLGTLT